MAITKNDFLNYTRCPRYGALEKLEKEKFASDISYDEYIEEERNKKIAEIYSSIADNILNSENIEMQVMNDYLKIVLKEAERLTEKQFKGKVNDKFKEAFDFQQNAILYKCYVDIYNEDEKEIRIIDVKATTSKKYLDLKSGYPKKDKYSIWQKKGNCYKLKGEIPSYPLLEQMPLKNYEKLKNKLYERFGLGEYFYELAVERFIIEGEYKETNRESKIKDIHYYLAVLNDNYVFDGTYVDNKPVYNPDNFNNELITFFDADEITKVLLEKVKVDANFLEKNLFSSSLNSCFLGDYCAYKKPNECKYFKEVCGKKIPKENSSLTYLNNNFGFIKEDKSRIKGLELINENYLHLLDVPSKWITNPNHKIERDCLKNHTQYLNKEKIKAGLAALEYPIYHLDFETFPCPIPRFKGERPYTQSPFEFSLHIERAINDVDKNKDNVVFLATTLNDEREKLVETLLNAVDVNKGTLLAQNVTFEKNRLKELANIFPKYKDSLMKLYNRGFDLLWIINNNKEMYKKLGFKEKDCNTINFYDERLNGSFSIKKTLPIFSNLSYKDLDVKNGTEAFVTYASYDKMDEKQKILKQEALRIYCSQDTWAMVEILRALRKMV